MKRLHLQVLATLISLGLCLVLLELSVRMLHIGQVMEFNPNSQWGYLMKPSQDISSYGHSVHINATGLRGPEPGPDKRDDQIRILFIGDSVTFGGTRIRENELFVRRTEEQLNAHGYPVEAISIAVPGWSPQNWIEYINARGIHDADIVVLTLPECDLGRPFSTLDSFNFKENAPILRVQSILAFFYQILLEPISPDGPFGSETDFQQNVQAVSRLLDQTRIANIPLVVLFIPSVPTSAHARLWPRFTELIDDPIDLREQLFDEKYFMDGVHLNTLGHAYVSSAVTAEIESRLQAGESDD